MDVIESLIKLNISEECFDSILEKCFNAINESSDKSVEGLVMGRQKKYDENPTPTNKYKLARTLIAVGDRERRKAKENLKEPFINNFYDIISEDPEYQVSLLKRIKLSPVEKNKIKKTAQEISDVELNDKDIKDYNKLIDIISDDGKGNLTFLFKSLVEKHVKDMALAEFNEWLDKPNTYSKYFPYDILGMENSEGRELCYQLSSLGIIPARELRDFLIKMKDDYVKTKMKKL